MNRTLCGAEAQQLDALHRPPLFLDMLLLMRASGIAGQYCGSERGGNLRTHGGDSFRRGEGTDRFTRRMNRT